MIARMSKYDFILFTKQSDDFIERLREIGLVDMTTTSWEPNDEDRERVLNIEQCTKAMLFIESFEGDKERCDAAAKPFSNGEEAFDNYVALQQRSAALTTEVARLEKLSEELKAWGGFSVEQVDALRREGVFVRLFSAQRSVYDKSIAQWAKSYTIEPISANDSTQYFALVTTSDDELDLDAQELKTPTMDYTAVEAQLDEERKALQALDVEFSRVVASKEPLQSYANSLKELLQGVQIKATAERAADDTLLIMQGWAEKATSDRVDALLEEYPNVVYLKSDPTPEDDTPVKLRNGWFAGIFEMVGDLYARPKYGTLDLTPFFAPFYMLYFGICLNDAGYGAILLAMGLVMMYKFKGDAAMRQASWFATLCGISTVAFGLFCGAVFGIELKQYFPNIAFFDFQGQFFTISLVIGIIQILFGIALNVWTKWSAFGFKYALGTMGWFILILSCCVAFGLPQAGIEVAWFSASSLAFKVVLGISAVLMLVLNTPGRNPLINIGVGMWDLYNNLTGLLSDVLSYVRLFAIGISGGILALVFNTLAVGFVPEGASIVTRLLIMIPILLIGHGINIFMSTISSFVHPMRLTFVEFYKNAGFEMASRSFEPLRKMDK